MTAVAIGKLSAYLGIRLRQNNLLMTIFGAAVHVCCVTNYCGTLGRVYRLQEVQKKLKCQLKAACGKVCLRTDCWAKKESLKGAVNALSCPACLGWIRGIPKFRGEFRNFRAALDQLQHSLLAFGTPHRI